MPDFLSYALSQTATTNFDVQTLGGLKQYITGYLAARARRGAARAREVARHAKEQERHFEVFTITTFAPRQVASSQRSQIPNRLLSRPRHDATRRATDLRWRQKNIGLL
jgi:hypothetical protein